MLASSLLSFRFAARYQAVSSRLPAGFHPVSSSLQCGLQFRRFDDDTLSKCFALKELSMRTFPLSTSFVSARFEATAYAKFEERMTKVEKEEVGITNYATARLGGVNRAIAMRRLRRLIAMALFTPTVVQEQRQLDAGAAASCSAAWHIATSNACRSSCKRYRGRCRQPLIG